ncbi:DEAD (Asp-Glu-Ala-Asp) box polypeptide 46 [Reticulomyxa filosa]|uniref:RNA helicase n=1 Tax=Reticulomyxa filosa TaxID=46433 RepID=X6N428_RETFI|nr:DEAD (Asp-Glu-Ala-Asp) box polypeptide 46 [Reticulomyxa filosa]|eukprot:ETO20067.1 DEAD (Asp-Glu-Ala-Asp) box polypeptide 46 [Reticulomyxa filosa]
MTTGGGGGGGGMGISKKEIPTLDHSKIKYEPFRKNLYVTAPEIARMTDAEVQSYREQTLEQCKVFGRDCARPIMKWTQCGFPHKMMLCLQHYGYTKPFAVQSQALPAIMSGRDVIASAKTGSGKTLAFVLPMLRHILDQRPVRSGEGPIGLILAPTRELAAQIYNETRRFSQPLGLSCSAVYGGASVSEQIAMLRKGSEIVVATPGRMIDMLCTNQGRLVNLQRVTYLVLDEADRMFDLGFEPQIHAIVKNIRPDRQTVMFSATFPKPIEKMAKQILTDPIQIIVGNVSTVCEDVVQCVQVMDNEDQKFEALLRLLSQWYGKGNILIFMDKREAVDLLYKKLQDNGYFSLVLHGGVDQTDRDFTILEFKNKRRSILISTSIAARGLDVKDLKVVINYTAPHHYEDYVHRVGRTGRAGTRGVAYTLLTRDEGRFAADIVKAMTKSNQTHNIPEELRQMVREFQDSVNSGDEKVFRHRGFHTKGFKFDEAEALQKHMQIERQKYVYGNAQEISDWDLPDGKDQLLSSTANATNANADKNVNGNDDASHDMDKTDQSLSNDKEHHNNNNNNNNNNDSSSSANRFNKELERIKKGLRIATKMVNRKEDAEKIKESVNRIMNVEKRKQEKETKAKVAKVAQMISKQLCQFQCYQWSQFQRQWR